MGRTVRIVLVVTGIAVVLALVAFGPQLVSHFTKKPPAAPGLTTVAVRSFTVQGTGSGTVEPSGVTNVNFATSGQVASISVAVGDTVGRGQTLAQLDDATQQSEIQAAQTAVASAQFVLNEAQSGAFPNDPAAAAQAQQSLASAQLQLQRAKADEAKTMLTAPAAGTVLQINGVAGGSAQAGPTGPQAVPGSSGGIINPNSNSANQNAFVVIGNAAALEVSATFSQQDTTHLSTGQTGTATFDAVPGLQLPVAVNEIASQASQVNGVPEFFVALALNGSDARLRVGMSVTVRIDTAHADNVLAVSSQAIYSLDGVPHVNVWYQHRAVATAVSTGLVGTQLTQITSGLVAGQQVVLSAQQPLPSPVPTARPSPS